MIQEAISQIDEDERIKDINIPDYCFDCHTSKGKESGKNIYVFVKDEWHTLSNRMPDIFDKDLEKIFFDLMEN